MEALIVDNDPLVRDQLKIALQQFPDVHVATGAGFATLNEVRSRTFDCVFLGVNAAQHESVSLLHHLREIDASAQLFVLGSAASCKDLAPEKAKFDVHGFLTVPLVPIELFAQLDVAPHRFLDRRQVRVGDGHLGRELEVVVEAALDRRPDRDPGPRVELLHGGCHHVSGVVPDQVQGVRIPVGHDLEPRPVRELSRQVLELVIHAHGESRPGQSRADRLCRVPAGRALVELERGAVGQEYGCLRLVAHFVQPA